jgi:HK97 family phage major capsid protein
MRNAITPRASLGLVALGYKSHVTGFRGPVFDRDDALATSIEQINAAVKEGNTAFEEFKRKNDERIKEIEGKGFDDVVRRDELDKISAAIDEAQKANDQFAARLKRIALYGKNADEGASAEEREAKAFNWWAGVKGRKGQKVTRDDFNDEAQEQVAAYKRAFDAYVRHNGDERSMAPDDLKALSVGSDPDGGYVVDSDTNGRIVARIFETSPMRQFASIQAIGTDALEGLHDNDEAAFGWVGETGARTETTTPKLEKWRIPVHEMYAKPSATQKLLDDASIDMEAWLAGKVTDRFTRAENSAFVNGSGVDRPRGFLTYPDRASADVFELGAIERFDTGVDGGFAAAPDGGDVLLDALYGLKAQYRANAVWFMNRATTSEVRQLKDSDGNYLWVPGIAAGQAATLLGYPVASFEDMPAIATDSLSIAVGDMREAYQIVDRIGVRVLRDPYSNKPYVEFYSTKRTGGDVVNFEAIKLIEFTA